MEIKMQETTVQNRFTIEITLHQDEISFTDEERTYLDSIETKNRLKLTATQTVILPVTSREASEYQMLSANDIRMIVEGLQGNISSKLKYCLHNEREENNGEEWEKNEGLEEKSA